MGTRVFPDYIVDQIIDYDLTFHILANDNLKVCGIHSINSNVAINYNVVDVDYGQMHFLPVFSKVSKIKEEKDVGDESGVRVISLQIIKGKVKFTRPRDSIFT